MQATIAVLVRNNKRLLDLLLLADNLKASGRSFTFIFSAKAARDGINRTYARGHNAIVFAEDPWPVRCLRDGVRKRINGWSNPPYVTQPIAEALKLWKLQRALPRAMKLLGGINCRAVISVKDKTNDFDAPLLVAARKLGLTILIPHIFISHLEGLETFMDDPQKGFTTLDDRSSAYTREAFRLFSHQTYKGRLFYPPHVTRSYARFGCLSHYPWLVGCGLSDIVCVDNDHTRGFYLQNKVPDEKIRVVGDLSNDPLHHSYAQRDAIRQRLLSTIAPGRDRVAIMAVPQVVEIGLLSQADHFSLLGQLVKSLARRGFSTLFSLHPKMQAATYRAFAKSQGAFVAEERLFHLLPGADLFLAWFSSTVTWAVLCGVPTIILDFYKERYPCYDYLTTPISAGTPEVAAELAEAALKSPPDFSADWLALSRDKVFDGKTFQRYAALLGAAEEAMN